MNVKVENQSSFEKKVIVEIPEAQVVEEIDKAYKGLKNQANIPGFRKGKAPRAILEKKYGPSVEAQVYQDLVRSSVAEVIEKENLNAINVKNISEPNRDEKKGFSYHAIIEVKPELKPKKYTGIKVKEEKVEVGDKEIEQALDHIRQSQAVLQKKEKALTPKKGDFAAIRIESLLATPGEENKAQERIYEVGAKGGQEVLDNALLKMTVGQSEAVTFHDKKNNKDLNMRVHLDEIKEKVLPEVNDDLAKSLGQFKTLAELKDKLKEDLIEEAQKRSKHKKVDGLLETLRKNNPVEVPPTLVSNEIQFMLENIQNQMRYSGVPAFPEDYTQEQIINELKPDAEKRVHDQLLIEAIAKAEDITVDDKAFNDKIADLAKQSKVPTAELKAYYEKTHRLDSVRFDMVWEKTIDFLLEKASSK
ncbi:trigger factor [bacterium]|nr:trigger factor [bacterium]